MKLDANTKYALIENNKVSYLFYGSEIAEIDENTLQVLEVPKDKENRIWIGCEVKNGQIQEVSLESAKSEQIEYINNRFNHEIATLQGEYVPKEEVLSYELQKAEAQSYLKDKDESKTPFLKALATNRGVKIDTLAQKIVQKNQEYSQKLATLMGYRHALRDEILACKSHEEVAQITYKSPYGFI